MHGACKPLWCLYLPLEACPRCDIGHVKIGPSNTHYAVGKYRYPIRHLDPMTQVIVPVIGPGALAESPCSPCWHHSQPWRLPIFPQSEAHHCGGVESAHELLSPYRQDPLILTRVNRPAVNQTPRRLRHLKVYPAYITPSIRASNGKIHAEVWLRDGVVATVRGGCPAQTAPPHLGPEWPGHRSDAPAVAASQSRPSIHHAQHKGLKRQNSRGGVAARRSGCYEVAAQPKQHPSISDRSGLATDAPGCCLGPPLGSGSV